MNASTALTPDERRSELGRLPDWRHWLSALHTAYDCGSAGNALALISEIGTAAQARDHHPDLDWRHRYVFLRLNTHSVGGRVTSKDVQLAADISTAAARLDCRAEPTLCRTVEIAVDTVDPSALSGPWAAALGYEVDAEGNLADPYRRNAPVWFQQTATPDQSRLHIDVTVEGSTADEVLGRAVAHGARRIDDSYRPSFTVLADSEQNRVCICTDLGRD